MLVVGLGSIGRRHARIARELFPEAEVVALRRTDSVPVEDPNIACFVSSMSQALEMKPEAAVIATPAPLHLDAATQLANAGVHLLIEKPIASDATGVAELVALCNQRNLALVTGYNLRFLPSLIKFRGMLAEKRVGRVLSVRAEVGQHLPSWRPGSDYRSGVSARAALGGGALLELSHEIDYLRWLFGEVSWVSAILARQSALEIDVEDTAHLVLGFEGAGDSAPVVASVTMDFVRHDATRSCVAICESGSLRWNAMLGTIEVFEEGAGGWTVCHSEPEVMDDSYRGEWLDFAASISTGGSPLVSGRDGLAVLDIVDAARRSSAGRMVASIGLERTGSIL